MTVRPRSALAAACGAALLAGCGAAPAVQAAQPARSAALALAGSAEYSGGTWAEVVMGGSAAQHNNFWELFVRPSGTAAWKLATPLGIASNGGFAVAAVGQASLAAAIRPSQKLAFTPLAGSTDNGGRWSQDGLLDAPLAGYPAALAAGPDGALLALTAAGQVRARAAAGAAWSGLAEERSVAASAAGRGCGLTGLTGAAYSPSGVALLAGGCARPGQAGIFRSRPGGWAADGPALPATLAHLPIDVLQISRAPDADVALLLAGHGRTASLLAAWSDRTGGGWRLSAPYPLRGTAPRSAAAGGEALGVLLDGGRAISIAGPGAAWRALPALPAGTAALPAGGATLATAPGGGFQALTARGGLLSVWTLGSGITGWHRSQALSVTIPYGSSG